MPKISLRRLLAKLTALALSTTTAGPALARVDRPSATTPIGQDPSRPVTPEPNELLIEDDDELDPELTIDLAQIDPADAAVALGRGLALALDKMRPMGATYVASSWALSSDGVRRLAIAHALEWTFPLVGDGVVIEHLAQDADPAIRVAAARAAWARRATGGDPGVLERLTADPDPEVRILAISARS
ncbi:MAG: hypothetical protein H0T79_17515 [Deltaproteobacteria bacterium]|nr:hypothetical protein [Deltaproteobacteria bacterium]